MTLKHFVTWDVTIKELRELATELEKCPVVSIPIDSDVELIFRRKEAKV